MKVLIAFVCLVVVSLADDQSPPGPPPFLEGAPQATIDAWNALVQTFGADTEKQINDAVTGFVGEHPEIKDKFESFKTQVLADQKAAEEQHKIKVASLSADAKAADTKLAAIADNESLTQDQKQKQIVDIFNGLSDGVKDELKSAGQ